MDSKFQHQHFASTISGVIREPETSRSHKKKVGLRKRSIQPEHSKMLLNRASEVSSIVDKAVQRQLLD